jgi:hypothetical protein
MLPPTNDVRAMMSSFIFATTTPAALACEALEEGFPIPDAYSVDALGEHPASCKSCRNLELGKSISSLAHRCLVRSYV